MRKIDCAVVALNFGYWFLVCRSGVARQPVTFFASPKKVTQKRRPRCHCPSGSQLCGTKNGKVSKLYLGMFACKRTPFRRRGACASNSLLHLRQRHFLYPFSVPHNWQCQKWVKVKSKVKNNDTQQLVEKWMAIDTDCFDVGVVFEFDLPPFETM